MLINAQAAHVGVIAASASYTDLRLQPRYEHSQPKS